MSTLPQAAARSLASRRAIASFASRLSISAAATQTTRPRSHRSTPATPPFHRCLHSTAAAHAVAASSSAAAASAAQPSTPVDVAPTPGTRSVLLSRSLSLSMGGELAAPLRLNYFDSAWEDLDGEQAALRKPVILIMPSMSHSALVTRGERSLQQQQQHAPSKSAAAPKGWWENMVGRGASFGIDLAEFRVLAASPLGTPYGSTSPLTADPTRSDTGAYRSAFPLITPLDQARLYAAMLDELGIAKVHAVVGSSMGGMQALQFARLYPQRYSRLAALCTTPHTSSSTQALRAVQRAAVRADPAFRGGHYADEEAAGDRAAGPLQGMAIARMFGTIAYRSRAEFDLRFPSLPKPAGVRAAQEEARRAAGVSSYSAAAPDDADAAVSTLPISSSPLFEVEAYLRHAAATFTGRYDANCYLTLSTCMDLMDMGQPEAVSAIADESPAAAVVSLEAACSPILSSAQFLLLPVGSDALIPAEELERLGSVLGAAGHPVHCERLHSLLGHDAFLKDTHTFAPRIRAFIDSKTKDGVQQVRRYVASLHDL